MMRWILYCASWRKATTVSVEMGDQVNFLKRTLTSENGVTKIQVNDKYLDGLNCDALRGREAEEDLE